MIHITATSILLLLTSALAQLNDPPFSTCSGSNIRNGSALEGNLKVVLNSLVGNVANTGFNISSSGQNGDQVYGLAQCRGDLNAPACGECVSQAKEDLGGLCGNNSGSIYHRDGCFLRYATHNFYSQLSNEMVKVNCTISNPLVGVDGSVASLLKKVVDDAVSSDVGYSTQNGSGIYALAQCWRDLNTSLCRQCLDHVRTVYTNLQSCQEGQSFSQNCMLRFDEYSFYGDAVPSPSPSPTTGSGHSIPPSTGPSVPSIPPSTGPPTSSNGTSHQLKVGLAIAGVVLVLVLLGLLVTWKRKVIQRLCRKQLTGHCKRSSDFLTTMSKSKLHYKYQTLQIATNNFNPINKLGEGAFGSVYKGVLPNMEIAVKRLFARNREHSESDFFNEVNLISNVQHKNLIKLLGFSVVDTNRFLVYEYVPNKSLDHFLFDENLGRSLDWQRRFEIIIGIADGLAYLHEESDIRIIHRDIKASNILLDQHFKPKIADFGLVRYFAEDQTHLSTGIVGTRGYMAPEYLVHGHLTEKVDVYAFGVLVLEIISGRKNQTPMHTNGMPSLLTVVWNSYLSSTLSDVIDPNIQENNEEEISKVVHVALLCTQVSARIRPSMLDVIMFLTTENPTLPAATQPPFIDVDTS